jgi:hypothetical protein
MRKRLVLLSNELILQELYQRYGNNIFSAMELLNRDFHWLVFSKTIEIEGLKVQRVFTYGYTLFENQYVRIWKI